MLRSLYHLFGAGLSAPQLGNNINLLVFNACPNGNGKYGDTYEYVMINPKIVETSEELYTDEEGCLSFPKIWGMVERPKYVRVEYLNRKGEVKNEELDQISTRIFLHEFDHLQGVSRLCSVFRLI